jgi:glycosyl transferase, family 25
MNDPATVVVINLKHRTDRRTAMEKQLSTIGWDAAFFPAIRPETAGSFPSIGARGCFLSHLAVLRHAFDARARRLVILEDDVDFSPNFAKDWVAASRALEQLEWSIFYPGISMPSLPSGLSVLAPSTAVTTSHFMIISGNTISAVVTGLEQILSRPAGHPLGGPMHVDGAYSTIRMQNPALITYTYSPILGYQRSSRSDIAHLRWFDRIGWMAPIAKVARKVKATTR